MNWQALADILADGQPVALICVNQLDMTRWRLLIHEHLNRPAFAHLNFFTLNQITRRHLISSLAEGERLSDRFLDRLLWERLLKRKDMLRPGFLREMEDCWEVFHWLGDPPVQPDSSPLVRELLAEMRSLQRDFGLVSEGELAARAPEKKGGGMKLVWMFPSGYNRRELCQIGFLLRAVGNTNHVFLHETLADAWGEPAENAAVAQWRQSDPTVQIHSLPFEVPQKNRKGDFFAIRRADTVYSECSLLAAECRRLLNQGVPAEGISILFGSEKHGQALRFIFSQASLPFDTSVRMPAADIGLCGLAADLLHCSGLQSGEVERSRLVSLISNRFLFLLRVIRQRAWQRSFEMREVIETIGLKKGTLKKFAAECAGKDKSGATAAFFAYLQVFQESMKKLNTPSAMADLLWRTLREISISPETGREIRMYLSTVETTGRLLTRLGETDFLFPSGITPAAFCEIFLREIHRARVKHDLAPGNFALRPPADQEGGAGISLRSLEEGLHSPVRHLFLCGFDDSCFPSERDRHHLHRKTGGDSYTLQPDASLQWAALWSSFAQASDTVHLSYAADESVSPNRLFGMLAELRTPGAGTLSAFSGVPLYRRLPGEAAGAGEEPLLAIDSPLLPETAGGGSDEAILTYQSILRERYTFSAENTAHTGATGISGSDRIRHASVTALEELLSCPQRYYFQRILRLRERDTYDVTDQMAAKETGSLFHAAARLHLEEIMSGFPGLSYRRIYGNFTAEKLRERLEASVEEALKMIPIPKLSEAVVEAQLRKLRESVVGYFTGFALGCASGVHPLSDFLPVAAEYAFKEVAFLNFIFKGSIDRIDYHPATGEVMVIDYKTGRKKGMTEFFSLPRLQLPLYTGLLRENSSGLKLPGAAGARKISFLYAFVTESAGDEFLPAFDKRESLGSGGAEDWYHQSLELLSAVSESVSSGVFYAIPRKKDDEPGTDWQAPCRYCDYLNMCDGNPHETGVYRFRQSAVSRRVAELMFPGEEDKGPESD